MRTTDQNKSLSESFAKEVFDNHNIQFLQETLADDFVEHEVAPGMTRRWLHFSGDRPPSPTRGPRSSR